MSKGAMAMAVAKILESKKYGDGGYAAREAGVSHARVSQARTVLQHAPALNL
jgi:hypothetical protein